MEICHKHVSAGRPLVSIHDALTFLSDLDDLSDPSLTGQQSGSDHE